ncbi:MAG: hypothetical protein EZS28_038561 [Streblomastix strix]|uniref:Uncharacterized protein n=1 Tax=Streblomastix strix TaxID=222440 RepID=A0A5J4U6Y5_9EUKA|nr:MAG: hypothetical protein EZS28_038561 [Streblomastix strix]
MAFEIKKSGEINSQLQDRPMFEIILAENQRHIIELYLEYVQALLQELGENMNKIQDVINMQTSIQSKHITQYRRKSLAIFTDNDDHHPPTNIDSESRSKMKEKMPLQYRIRKWTDQEVKSLAVGIKEQNQHWLYDQALAKYNNSSRSKQDEELYTKEKEAINMIDERQLEASKLLGSIVFNGQKKKKED